MEDNTTNMLRCIKGCGFYGNPTFNNMCSQCFKETSNKNGQNANNITSTTSTNQINLPLTTTKFEGSSVQTNTTATAEQVTPLTTTTITANSGESVAEP
nr:3457_t:CDS:2 [Entrophospora candida]